MKSFFSNTYPYKHWLTSLVIVPFILLIGDLISGNNTLNNALAVFVLFILFGLVCSFPVFAIYLLVFNVLIRKTNSVFIIKAILNVITIAGVFITVKLIGGTMMTVVLAAYYSGAIIICSLFYKIKKQTT
ncbi:MAG: hypothetical protein K0S33_3116 [Bacteroidetes bacterium]|jgi:Sec-independent protein secretion pathway component TatC|nr:hypothetical protein [Bacteroidota bacterium]